MSGARQGPTIGHVNLDMGSGTDGALVYEGDFSNDLREGLGIIRREGHPIPMYVGCWSRDLVCTTGQPAWAHLVGPGETQGRFYHGELSPAGFCEGFGTLYEAHADDDHEFLNAMASGLVLQPLGS